MKIDTICNIAIAAGSFLIGGSLGLALGGGCDICGKRMDDDIFEFEEDIVEEEDSIVVVNPTDVEEYEDKASKYYVLGSISEEGVTYQEAFVISRTSYENEYMDFHKESLVYFERDQVLIDDRDEIVDNVEHILGSEALESFGKESEDEDIVYVRNMRMQCDFEVVREHMSYKENVLGIEEETEEYREARRFFNLEE